MGYSARLLSVAVAAAGFSQLANADCSHNNCYRAVKADAFTTRSGLADCNSYLSTLVILPTSTTTEYISTVTSWVTSPSLTTSVQVNTEEATNVLTETETQTETEVTTSTDLTTTSTTATEYTTTQTFTQIRGTLTFATTKVITITTPIFGRGVAVRTPGATITISGSIIPPYATACTPAPDAYISACSCIGATATVSTTQPVKTCTETSTVWSTAYTPDVQTSTVIVTETTDTTTTAPETQTTTATTVQTEVTTDVTTFQTRTRVTETVTKTITVTKYVITTVPRPTP